MTLNKPTIYAVADILANHVGDDACHQVIDALCSFGDNFDGELSDLHCDCGDTLFDLLCQRRPELARPHEGYVDETMPSGITF